MGFIFRNFTENDYGIDFEIELVSDDQVTGKYIKVQVKTKEDLTINQDNSVSISGIKQSTFTY